MNISALSFDLNWMESRFTDIRSTGAGAEPGSATGSITLQEVTDY